MGDRRAPARSPTRTAEDLLQMAMAATTPAARSRWARKGLATRAPLDRTTQAMLLRQLSLSLYEARRFEQALAVALQAIELGVLPDVLHQDAARAALASGDVDDAVSHLRIAARRGPASRRPFHLWTLGSVLFLAHRYAEATAALERAVRWGTRDKPLYKAHLALVRLAAGEAMPDLQSTIDDLGGRSVWPGLRPLRARAPGLRGRRFPRGAALSRRFRAADRGLPTGAGHRARRRAADGTIHAFQDGSQLRVRGTFLAAREGGVSSGAPAGRARSPLV